MRILSRHSRSLFFWLGLVSFVAGNSQSLLFPGDYMFDVPRQRALALDTTADIHTSLQPFLYNVIRVDTFKHLKAGADPFFDKLFYEDLISLKHVDKSSGYDRKFDLTINPILDLHYGKDLKDSGDAKVQYNTRGFWLHGELGKKLIFESAFIENQAFVPVYLYNYGRATGIVPGQGRWKKFHDNSGFDYATAYGILNYAVSKNFTIRLGHGKQKIGNGYRSLLLSDNALNYPYAQFIARFFRGKLQYSQTYALLMNLTDGGAKTPPNTEPIYQKKAASFQHMSFRPNRYFDIYFFQGMIWNAADSSNTMHIDAFYANPIIFTNLIKYGFNNYNHILAGGGFEVRPIRKLQVYGQWMYDGHYQHAVPNYFVPNWGIQGGIKYYDAFGIRNLALQVETNFLTGKSYFSQKSAYQDYSHYNQVLATPAVLPNEAIFFISYSYKRFFIQLKENIQTDNSSYAAFNYFDGKVGYMLNPRYNLNVAFGSNVRSLIYLGAKASEMNQFYISLRTSLYNLYNDF